jgi:D-amino peptidase
MKVFVSADMEGISSVAGWADVTPGSLDYQRACHWMTQDVNAAIQGALKAGAKTILVNDGHSNQRNIIPDELDAHAELIRGYTKPLGMMEGIDRKWDAALFVGNHTRLGVRDGLMGHTLSSQCFRDVRLNGHPVTEAELNAAIAGEFAVPVVMVSGDSALERDVKAFMPGVLTAVVKTSLEYETTVLLHPSLARQRIMDAACLGLERAPATAPYRVETPCLVEAEFQNLQAATLASSVPTVSRLDDSTVSFEAADMATVMRVLKVFLKLGST